MAIWTLDVQTDTTVDDFEQDHELDGRLYTFRFMWNRRDNAWRFSLFLPDGTPLVYSRKIVVGFPLIRGEVDNRLPPGVLVAFDTLSTDTDPAQDELGARVPLVYYDAAEIAA